MSQKPVFLLFAAVLLLASYFYAFAEEAIKHKFADCFPLTHKNAILFDQYSQEINKKSNAKVEISCYANGTLLRRRLKAI